MSIQAVAWVLEHSETRGAARLALISIANYADKNTGECFLDANHRTRGPLLAGLGAAVGT